MSRTLSIGYRENQSEFSIHDYDDDVQEPPATALPRSARSLMGEIDAWQAHRERHWTPKNGWDDDTRWWYAKEARRLQRELERVLPAGYTVIVSPWPAVTELTLMNEYMSGWPIWDFEGLTARDDPRFADLSPQLRAALHAWAEYFVANFDPDRGWRNSYAEFHREGERLRSELSRELGPGYEIALNEWTR